MKTTEENNKMIAEFLGWKNHFKNGGSTVVYLSNEEHIQDWEFFHIEKEMSITPIEMKFHSSWNWLMSVVEKIESIGYGVEIIGNYCKVIGENIQCSQPKKIEATYKAVVQFIEWYNEQN